MTVRRTRTVEVAVDGVPAPRWRGKLRRFCSLVMQEAGAVGWELSLLLCDDSRMMDLNRRYRGAERPTDVLSFPGHLEPTPHGRPLRGRAVTGDIAFSLDTLRRNAREYGVSVDEELKRLVVHGILHCAGMDHGSDRHGKMLALQESLLAALEKERIIGK